MQVRFSQRRDEIDAGLFKRIDYLRRHFAFYVFPISFNNPAFLD